MKQEKKENEGVMKVSGGLALVLHNVIALESQ